MLQMVWEWVSDSTLPNGGTAHARKPRGRDGAARVPDGVKWLSLEQVMERTGRTREYYLRDYRSAMADLLGEEDAAQVLVDELVPPADPAKTTSDAAPAAKLSADHPETHVPPAQLARLDLLRVMRYPEFSDPQWEYFLAQCQLRRLNPMANQVMGQLQPDLETRQPKVVLIVMIDGFRLIADRTGLYAGVDVPKWEPAEGLPMSATVTVHKLVGGEPRSFTAVAHYDEYAPISLEAYRERMPRNWLAKCAEALALRKAFPQELGGLYTPEEMAQANPVGRGGPGDRRFEPSVDRRPGVYDAIDPPSDDGLPVYQAHGQDRKLDPLKAAHRRLATAGRS